MSGIGYIAMSLCKMLSFEVEERRRGTYVKDESGRSMETPKDG